MMLLQNIHVVNAWIIPAKSPPMNMLKNITRNRNMATGHLILKLESNNNHYYIHLQNVHMRM